MHLPGRDTRAQAPSDDATHVARAATDPMRVGVQTCTAPSPHCHAQLERIAPDGLALRTNVVHETKALVGRVSVRFGASWSKVHLSTAAPPPR